MTAHDNQRILFAVGLGHDCILGYEGSLVFPAVTDPDGDSWRPCWLDADGSLPYRDMPKAPGLYVWEGRIGADYDDRLDEVVIDMAGATRPATPEDVAALLGKHDAPEPDDDDRDSPGV